MDMIRNFSTPTSVLVITLSSRDLIKATSYLLFSSFFSSMVWLIFFGPRPRPRLFLFLFLKICFVYAFEARIYFTWNLNDADDVPSEFFHVEILGSCNSRSKIAKLQDQEKLLLKAREKRTPGSLC
jgi:hypothetical protein